MDEDYDVDINIDFLSIFANKKNKHTTINKVLIKTHLSPPQNLKEQNARSFVIYEICLSIPDPLDNNRKQ